MGLNSLKIPGNKETATKTFFHQMRAYRILNKQNFNNGKYSIVPIRRDDRYDIMSWRNEQQYHLRQNEPLTKEGQDKYFDSVIADLFKVDKPSQILFSYLCNGKCIGYGGLVHINWTDRNAEVSFIIETKLEEKEFSWHWSIFLDLIQEVAFEEVYMHKLFIYAFDLRPHLYDAIERKGFKKEAILKEHCLYMGNFIDVVIHSKFAPL